MSNFDYEDLANLHNKLDSINRNLESANKPKTQSTGGSSGWSLSFTVKFIIGLSVAGALLCFSSIAFIGIIVLLFG